MLSNKVDIALCTKVGPAVANKEICKGDVANPLQTNPLQMGAISLEKLFAQMPGVWLLWMVRIMPFSFWTNKLRAVPKKCSPTLIMVTGPFSFSFFLECHFCLWLGGCLAEYKTIWKRHLLMKHLMLQHIGLPSILCIKIKICCASKSKYVFDFCLFHEKLARITLKLELGAKATMIWGGCVTFSNAVCHCHIISP